MSNQRAYITIEAASALLLLLGALLALVISNTPFYDEYVRFINLPISLSIGNLALSKTLIKWVNDGLMSLFFLVLTLEIKYHLLEGDLIDKAHIKLGSVAALGGAVIPAIIYYSFTYHNPTFVKGWGIPIATDTAFVLGILSFFNNKITTSARIFVIFLSVIDDAIAVLVLAIFYTPYLHFTPLLFGSMLLFILGILNALNVRYIFPYIFVGIGLWLCIVEAGIHGAITGVLLGFFIPFRIKKENQGFYSPLKKLEHFLHPCVAFIILPIFAFLNAEISFKGITFNDFVSPITFGVIAGLFVGKQAGVILSSLIFLKFSKSKLPYGLDWPSFYAIGALYGIGFTFSLFIGLLSFEDSNLINQMKLGVILGSIFSALVGIFLLMFKSTHSK